MSMTNTTRAEVTVYNPEGRIVSRHPDTEALLIGTCTAHVGGLTAAHLCGQPAYGYVNPSLFLPRCDDAGHQRNVHPMSTSAPASAPTPSPLPYPPGAWSYEKEIDGYGVARHTGRIVHRE